jgi:hypothetical protein
MGFVISVIYFVTYYLTPPLVFGPLAAYRIELILAILVLLVSLPKLAGSIVLKTTQSLALIGLSIAVFLSTLIALRWMGGAVASFLGFIPCAFAYYLVCLHCDTSKRLRILVLMLLFVCFLVIGNGYMEMRHGFPEEVLQQPDFTGSPYVLMMKNDTGDWIYRLRGLGEINDPNDFAQLLVCVIPLVFFFWQPKRTWRNIVLVLLPVGILICGTFLTHSRGGLLALMAVAAIASRRKIGTMPALVLAGGIFAAAMASHFTGGRDISTEAGADRTALWGDGLQILKSHPLFGVGLGNFADNCDGCGHTAHNTLVVCAAELGSIGLFFWCLFLYPTMKDVLAISAPERVSEAQPSILEVDPRTRKKPKPIDRQEVNRLSRLLLLSLIGFLVTGWFLSRAYVLTFFLLGGLVEAIYEMALKQGMIAPRPPLVRAIPASAGLALSLILLMYVMLRTMNFMH